MEWNGDEHGTAVIRPNGDSGFAWVAPRRSYCDRGHWDWGFQSLPNLPGAPSYYFMELATALEEIEMWLAQAPPVGQLSAGKSLLAVNSAGLHSIQGLENAPEWQESAEGGIVCGVVNGDERMSMSIRPVKDGFLFNLEGLQSIDESDRFPRLYRNAETAMREAGLFAQWRLARIPAQVPGSLPSSFSHEVDPAVASAITRVQAQDHSTPRTPRRP